MVFCYVKYVYDLVSDWSEHIVFPVVVLLPVSVCVASLHCLHKRAGYLCGSRSAD